MEKTEIIIQLLEIHFWASVYFQMYCHSSPVIEWKPSIDFTMRFEKTLNYSGILSNKISMGKKCICNISMVDSYIQEHLEVDN